METAVSVIIPAYNMQAYLPACLDSVLAQSFRDFEVILVDDGSADGTAAICDRYAERDPRVRVIHKENGGVSAARNTGIEAAAGEYFWFVDADDRAEPHALETAVALARERRADVLVFGYRWDVEGGRSQVRRPVFPDGVYEGEAVIPELLSRFVGVSDEGVRRWTRGEDGGLYVENPALWRVLVSGSMVRDRRLRFDPALKVGEDTIFIARTLSHAARCAVTGQSLYRHRVWEDSTIARYERDPGAKLAGKEALLTARADLTADILARRGVDIEPYWRGSAVMSCLELAFLLSKGHPELGRGRRYRMYRRYVDRPDTRRAVDAFTPEPGLGIKRLPLRLLKGGRHGLLFFCAGLLNRLHYEFQRG